MKTVTAKFDSSLLFCMHCKGKIILTTSNTLKQKTDTNLTFDLNIYLQLLYSISFFYFYFFLQEGQTCIFSRCELSSCISKEFLYKIQENFTTWHVC